MSISGYHIAEAGANPITQLAFTLANGFTYVEAYLARGHGHRRLRAEPVVLLLATAWTPSTRCSAASPAASGRSRCASATAPTSASQKLKYHVQTSGRSLHAQEMAFNDIRTTLQALCAIYDNANSLHTNAYDEAVTTPTRTRCAGRSRSS